MPKSPAEVFNRVTRAGSVGTDSQELRVLSGEVPAELDGVLFRNGPGRLSVFDKAYDHLFDGDGFVQRFEFRGGTVRYRSRYVETPEFQREEQARRMLYRAFGTNLPGGLPANAFRFHFKNAANTNVLWTGGRLLALWEGGAPFEIDPLTLDCGDRWYAGESLRSKTLTEKLMANGRPFSAHPKVLPEDDWAYSFGLSPGVKQRLLHYRVHLRTGETQALEQALPRLTFIHDFVALSGGTRVFFDVGVAFHLTPALIGAIPPAASIRGSDKHSTLIRVLDSGNTERSIEAPSGYVFHLPNGYRRSSQTAAPPAGTAAAAAAGAETAGREEELVLDTCWMDHFPDADDFRAMLRDREPEHRFRPTLTRHRIDVKRQAHSSSPLSEYPMELPSINPSVRGRRHQYVWGVAEPPDRDLYTVMHGVLRVDTESGRSKLHDFYPWIIGEPLFVPTRGAAAGETTRALLPGEAEDDGFLLSLAFDPEAEQSHLLIIRADTLETLTDLLLPEPVHSGFHGIWLNDDRVRMSP